MIRYSYNQQTRPPAPFVHVTLRCPETGQEAADLPAQLDIAADRTAIPGRLVETLTLVPLDEIMVSGFGGQMLRVPTYRLELAVRSFPPVIVEVIAHPEESIILLGRDVLNRHKVTLDGPGLVFEIE